MVRAEATETDHAVEAATGGEKKRRRRRNAHRGPGGRTSVIREQVTDVGMAIRELQAAQVEIAEVPEHLIRWQRRDAMLEPMSRLQLVRKFIDGVLKRNGYSPEAL